jgi:xanthine/uracil/vitamin C permease (AzgA family)
MSRWAQAAVLVGVAVAAAAAVAVVGIALGGPGGSASTTDYQESVIDARNQVELALAGISEATSVEELLAQLDEAAVAVQDAAVDLAGAGVADGFEDENDKLVGAMTALSSELSGTAETLRDPAFAEALPRLSSLSFKQWEAVNRILTALKKQGIDVEPLARH